MHTKLPEETWLGKHCFSSTNGQKACQMVSEVLPRPGAPKLDVPTKGSQRWHLDRRPARAKMPLELQAHAPSFSNALPLPECVHQVTSGEGDSRAPWVHHTSGLHPAPRMLAKMTPMNSGP